jgi:hypothetical protein
MKTSEVFVPISEGMIRTNAVMALVSGVSTKKVREYLIENGYVLSAWETSSGRKYMIVQKAYLMGQGEYEPSANEFTREQFEKALQQRYGVEI